MKGYVEACKVPLIKVGATLVPKIMLGHLPFVGQSYQGREKDEDFLRRFSDPKNIIRVIAKAAREYGLTAMSVAPNTLEGPSHILLRAIKEAIKSVGIEIAVAPCLSIPLKVDDRPIDDYRRWLTYLDYEVSVAGKEVLNRYINDPILLCRPRWRENFIYALTGASPYSDDELKKLRVDYGRLREVLRSLEGFKVMFIEPGSEVDFLALTGKLDLLEELISFLKDKVSKTVVLGTHHAGMTIPILDEAKIKFDGYLTPVNKLGVMMFPTEELALRGVEATSKVIIAIKTMAGGRVPPREAFQYVFKEVGVEACMIGVGSEEELDEDVKEALKVL